ncbi:conserved hypothetical protein [Gammaproteobacteria bacterium]
MRKILLLCGLGIFGLWSSLIKAEGPEFSADVVTINLNDRTERVIGKIYIGNFRQRKEMSISDKRTIEEYGQTVVQIINPQRQAMWQLFPEKRKYWERNGKIPMEQPPLPGDSRHPCSQGKEKGISCAKLGTDNIGNRQTDKWELSFMREGKTMRSLVWIDPKLGMAIREESPGMAAMELRNIKEEAQPDNLFELPNGYQKTEPPQGRSAPSSSPGSNGASASPPSQVTPPRSAPPR